MVLSSFEQYELYLDTYPPDQNQRLYLHNCVLNSPVYILTPSALFGSITDDSNGPYSDANLTLDIEGTEDYGY